MPRLISLLFCVACLSMVVIVAKLAYPLAARSAQEVEYSVTPMGAEMFDDVDLGDFGMVPVLDMMQHYIDNPPAASATGDSQIRFQGC